MLMHLMILMDIYIYSEKLDYISAGDIIEIEITRADSYDLYAKLKNKVA